MKFYIVDCFAGERYQGNQLLVVIPDRELSDAEQLQIAREINFSETSFILSGKQENGGYDVRIWLPREEVPFAGHPTLGTAYVIHEYLDHSDEVKLNLKVGQIVVSVSEDGLVMRQNAPVFSGTVSREEIAAVYGITAEEIRDDFPVQWVSTGLEAVVIPLKERASLARVRTDRQAFEAYIRRHPENFCSHLFFVDMGDDVLTARCMTEDLGEDPATGSANGDLACYMLEHDYFRKQDIRYTVIQGEDMGRKSVLHIHGALNGDRWTVEVGGSCHLVAEGDWK